MDLPRLLTELRELAFPPRCQVCDRFGPSPLCEACAASFERISAPFCERCGVPFDPAARSRSLCGTCSDGGDELDAARSLGLHVGVLRDAVNALKFEGRTRLAEPLGELLSALVGHDDAGQLPADAITHIIPVPLHDARRSARGFDQAELLALPLGAAIDRPVRTRLLERVRNTRPQIGLNPRERDANVRGAFRVPCPVPLTGMRALLVDDVYTTGATLRACARALRAAKAEAVYAATASRAAPEWHPAADLISDV